MMDLDQTIEWAALNNAIKHKGCASEKAVIGSILQHSPQAREQMVTIAPKIKKVIEQVNSLGVDEQRQRLEQLGGAATPKPRRTGLKELPNANKGKVVMRIAPSPSGALHIGHAYALLLSAIYCKRYDGKLILRIEDTNPENIYPEAYALIERDAQWVAKGRFDEVVIQSDRLELYYAYAERVLEEGWAYICTCDPERFRGLIQAGRACLCRELPPSEQLLRWGRMLTDYAPGEAVMRIKTDLTHKNPAMRDWPAMRINTHEHPRQGTKYRVWPLMNFSVFVDDLEMGMTHILRGKDHADNARRQADLHRRFNNPEPITLFVGRINLKGLPLSSSFVRKKIDEGHYAGWDDIRLPFLPALRRRGFEPETFWRYAEDVGVSPNDKTVAADEFYKSIYSYNRSIIEQKTDRYFIVIDPVLITIEGAPERSVTLDLHPEHRRGGRTLATHDRFFIAHEDLRTLEQGKLYRLKDCLNFIKDDDGWRFDSEAYERYRGKGAQILHYLPESDALVRVELRMPDNTVLEGLGEPGLADLEPGTLIQAERVGFMRIDAIEDGRVVCWYTHP